VRIGFVVLGAVLLGIAWWMTQPLQTSLFGLFNIGVANPLAPFSFPVGLAGAGSLAYGVLTGSKRRH